MTEFPPRLLTLADLETMGVSSTGAQRLVRSGTLHRVAHGVYAGSPWWHALGDRERTVQRHLAVTRTAAAPPVFCQDSAALLHGWRLLRDPPTPQVLHAPGSGTRSTDRAAHPHSGRLPDEDIAERNGVLLTTPERTALDCARFLPLGSAVVVLDQALAAGVEPAALAARLARLPGHRGVRRARTALDLADPLSESPGESLTRIVLLQSALPPFVSQLTVRTGRGGYRADFAWPEARVLLEFDGRVKYFLDTPTGEVLYAERQRELALVEAGWTVLRTDWETVTRRPEQLVARLHRVLRGRAPRR
ncbi:type IV toxin-antitoxin system AbiEi family antitoxin domain-containing protein [uncultured Kocuria sp.]|uniref:type IV toxin-antitoxin system AbiEi family antitoxin domain-containing protein n=1 Tax=uncultured Kocuria sp. TaxID=259305 RepID=UPI00262377AC|nr:type IV toxin-antitoxin system AbiEi family antitoxin domain-containing protein [uncultured Kocuria sp.]